MSFKMRSDFEEVTIAKPVQRMKEGRSQMFFDLKFKAREELKLIMYSLSPNDLLREVFIMTKHLKLKCQMVLERNRSC